jgi:hypothetical protein
MPGGMVTDQWGTRMQALGAFIRSQRKLANLSLRQLAELSTLSNPYLSQLERGMHQPSVRVLKLISGAPACAPTCITVARVEQLAPCTTQWPTRRLRADPGVLIRCGRIRDKWSLGGYFA